MNVERALANLLRADEDYRAFFRRCCETSAERLVSQAQQFGDELERRGVQVDGEDLEDALLILARKVLPDSLGSAWPVELAAERASAAYRYCAKLYPGEGASLDAVGAADNAAMDAETDGDWRAYSVALREMKRAAREAWGVRERTGAA
jgi:hypothetical protein